MSRRFAVTYFTSFVHAEASVAQELVEPLYSTDGGLLTAMYDWALQQVPLLGARALDALQQIASQPALAKDYEEPLAVLAERWKDLLKEKRALNRYASRRLTCNFNHLRYRSEDWLHTLLFAIWFHGLS